MLGVIQKKEDETKLIQLTHRIQRGEKCSVPEVWFIMECLAHRRGLTQRVTQSFQELMKEEAWIRSWMASWGVGVERDHRRAAEILTPHEQDPLYNALLGRLFLWNSEVLDEPRGLELLERSSEAGCAEGIYCLSRAYLDGKGVAEDKRQAYELACRAADLSHPDALCVVGSSLKTGRGVERNVHLALRYHEKACSYGHSISHMLLGVFYECGAGVAVDMRRAASLYRKSVVLGYKEARAALDWLPAADTIPWGEWCPDPLMHNYVPLEMHHQMRTLLLIHARKDTLLFQLPKHLVLDICFWLCTNPN